MIYQHNDWSGKNCPMLMRQPGRWEAFINTVQSFDRTPPEDQPMTPSERAEFDAMKSRLDEVYNDTWKLKAATYGNKTRVICTESNKRVLREVTGQDYAISQQADLEGEKALEFAFRMGLSLQLANFSNSQATQELAQVVSNLAGGVDVAELLHDLANAWEASNG